MEKLFIGVSALSCVAFLFVIGLIIGGIIKEAINTRKVKIKTYEATVRVFYDHDETVRFEYVKAKNKQEVWQELYDRYERCSHNYRVERIRKCR